MIYGQLHTVTVTVKKDKALEWVNGALARFEGAIADAKREEEKTPRKPFHAAGPASYYLGLTYRSIRALKTALEASTDLEVKLGVNIIAILTDADASSSEDGGFLAL